MKFYNILEFAVFFVVLISVGNSAFAAQEVVSDECGMRAQIQNVRAADTVILRKIDGVLVESFFPIAGNMKRLSKVCEIALMDETKYNASTRLAVSFRHEPTEFRPRIYTWDQMKKTWKSHESVMNRKTWTTSAEMPLKKQYVAVFVDERSEYAGLASWYRHKRNPMGAATNIFPIGTKLRVTNQDTGKDVRVTVTSTWTNKDKRRVLDLVRTAFEKIGNPKQGLIPVIIERIAAR